MFAHPLHAHRWQRRRRFGIIRFGGGARGAVPMCAARHLTSIRIDGIDGQQGGRQMVHTSEPPGIPDERIAIEQRADGTVVVRVRSESATAGVDRLPDAVFSFRCGDPQYSYWLSRFNERTRDR